MECLHLLCCVGVDHRVDASEEDYYIKETVMLNDTQKKDARMDESKLTETRICRLHEVRSMIASGQYNDRFVKELKRERDVLLDLLNR